MKRTAAILMCFGLALLGFASAAYSGATTHTDTTVTCGITAITSATLIVNGNNVQTTFTVRSDCDAVEVSLVSYTMPGPMFDENTADEQVLSAATTVTVGAGTHTLSLAVPSCFYQVDFVLGQPLQTLGPVGSGNFYSSQGRYISAATGGSAPCSTTTTTTPTTTAITTTTATTTASTTTATTTALTTTTTATTTASTTAPGTTTTPSTPGTTTTPSTTTTAASVPPPTTTTATTTTTPTTTAPFVPPPTSTTATTVPPTATTTGRTTTNNGPFTPPPLQPPGGPTQPAAGPGLPFTGISLGLAVLLGILLVAVGLVLRIGVRPLAAPTLAVAGVPTGPRVPNPSRFVAPRSPVKARIFVPGVGEFDSIDAAERRQLDLRWARQGARFLGHRDERREP